ncbi:MAG: hypothetical protein HYY17_01295 [Planctomycetes bacterium]|nr:hypothetical protein [Planctomycetota bacterium]
MSRMLIRAALLPFFACFLGCESEVELQVQSQINTVWSDAAKKSQVEDAVEAEIRSELESGLEGTILFQYGLYFVYIHDIPWVRADLGDTPPTFNAWNVQENENTAYRVLQFDWELTWESGNGAEVSFYLDLRPTFPDHTVRIYDITGRLSGHAYFRWALTSEGTDRATVSVTDSSIDCKAEAEGWFWTVDISETVKDGIDQGELRKIAREQIKAAFGF